MQRLVTQNIDVRDALGDGGFRGRLLAFDQNLTRGEQGFDLGAGDISKIKILFLFPEGGQKNRV